MMFEQCDGDMAWSDGTVYYIRTFDATDDYDNDGCNTQQELSLVETSGGKRDPANFWDFFDTDTENGLEAGSSLEGAVSVGDVFAVAGKFGATGNPNIDPLSDASGQGYHTRYDRGPTQGPDPWDLTPPDGGVALTDVFAASAQFGHSCV